MESRQLLIHAQRFAASCGHAYASSAYDQERYEEIRTISVTLPQELTEEPLEQVICVFADEDGY